MLEKYFHLREQGTTIKTELLAGLTTFLTMAYIIFVNSSMLAQTGMDKQAVFVATCLAAALGSFIMGLYANLPIALAPGMGLNAFFTYTVVLKMGHSWQVALGCVFWSGLIFLLISLFRLREWLIQAIPLSLKKAIGAGIGAFLAFIALQNGRVIVASDATLVHLGNLGNFPALMTFTGLFLIIALNRLRISGAVMIAVFAVALLAVVLDNNQLASAVLAPPPSLAPTFFQLDLLGALRPELISVIFAFFFVDLFDTAGTLIGVTDRAGLSKRGEIPHLKKALLADSGATVIGALLGTSNTTSYVESAAGVAVGGRTGLMAVVTGLLFLLALFFAPLMTMIPSYATTGAILYVAILMMYALKDIDWGDISEATPVALTFLMIPLSYSIADGITVGFISYSISKLITGRGRELNGGVLALSLILLGRLVFM